MTDMYDFDEKAAARIIGVTPRTLRNWRSAGAIGYHRMPGGRIRYTMDQILDLQRSTRVSAAPDRTFPHTSA